MVKFVASKVVIDSEILRLLESISRKQGHLLSRRQNITDELRIEGIASIDAVHFSTKIEGNSLTRDQVTHAMQSKKKAKVSERQLMEVLNYARVRRSVREWALKKNSFEDQWVLRHHNELLKGIVVGKLRGHYRNAQCVIKDSKTNAIVYMAADWHDVPSLMKGLLSWLRRELKSNSSPVLLAAQFHFEFVTIHPFMDGNGRLARLLSNGILFSNNHDVERYAALEKQHELKRNSYYQALRSLQANNYYDIPQGQDIQSWVKYWLHCLDKTYDEALSRVTEQRNSDASFDLFNDRIDRASVLFRRHIKLRASDYADLSGVGRTQAVADLNLLMEKGLIERVGGGRSTVYKLKKKKQ